VILNDVEYRNGCYFVTLLIFTESGSFRCQLQPILTVCDKT